MPGPSNIPFGNIGLSMLLSVSLTPASVASATSAEQTFTVNGLLVGDCVAQVSSQAAWTSLTAIVSSRVTAANTLGISFQNQTGGALTPPSGTYYVRIERPLTLSGAAGNVAGALPSAIV